MVDRIWISRSERTLAALQWALVGLTVIVTGRMILIQPGIDPAAIDDAASFIDQTVPITEHPRLKPIEWYAPIWQRDLRQPPIPPVVTKEPEPAPRPKPRPPLPRLLGTFRDPTAGWAHLLTPESTSRLIREQDALGEFILATVQPGRVQLRRGKESYWIEIPNRQAPETHHP